MVENLVNDLKETKLAEEREREEELKWLYKVSDAEVMTILGAIRVNTNFVSVLEGLIFGIRRGYVLGAGEKDITKLQFMLDDAKEQLDAHLKHLDMVKRNMELLEK